MMLSEISKNDVKEIQGSEMPSYRDIKPESGMSVSEANKYWDNLFNGGAPEISKIGSEVNEEPKQYFDDNRIKYREGDNLKPSTKFERNGYIYETDKKGRVISAVGQLKMRAPEYKRNMEKVRKLDSQEYKNTDDQGHLIGHQFGGSDKLENLVPMDAKLNKGDFAKLEKKLADAVKDGADVRMKIEPVYEGNSTRPTEFRVTYSIDGEKDAVVFKNRSDD